MSKKEAQDQPRRGLLPTPSITNTSQSSPSVNIHIAPVYPPPYGIQYTYPPATPHSTTTSSPPPVFGSQNPPASQYPQHTQHAPPYFTSEYASQHHASHNQNTFQLQPQYPVPLQKSAPGRTPRESTSPRVGPYSIPGRTSASPLLPQPPNPYGSYSQPNFLLPYTPNYNFGQASHAPLLPPTTIQGWVPPQSSTSLVRIHDLKRKLILARGLDPDETSLYVAHYPGDSHILFSPQKVPADTEIEISRIPKEAVRSIQLKEGSSITEIEYLAVPDFASKLLDTVHTIALLDTNVVRDMLAGIGDALNRPEVMCFATETTLAELKLKNNLSSATFAYEIYTPLNPSRKEMILEKVCAQIDADYQHLSVNTRNDLLIWIEASFLVSCYPAAQWVFVLYSSNNYLAEKIARLVKEGTISLREFGILDVACISRPPWPTQHRAAHDELY